MNRRQWLTMFAAALAALRWPRQAHAQGSSYVQRGAVGLLRVRGGNGLDGTDRARQRARRAADRQGHAVSRRRQDAVARRAGLRVSHRSAGPVQPEPGDAFVAAAWRGADRPPTARSSSGRSGPPRTRRRASRSTFMWSCRPPTATSTPANGVLPTTRWSKRPSAPSRRARARLDGCGRSASASAAQTIDVKVRVNPDRAFS